MIPGEVIVAAGEIELNAARPVLRIEVTNNGDRPIEVGSHYHFFETNPALQFEREATRGHRLDIPAGDRVRFEPDNPRVVELVPYQGARVVYGFRAEVMGPLDTPAPDSARS